jgi:signal transduction histidine kinase
LDGKIICYIQFPKENGAHWVPDDWFIALFLLSLLISVSWLQLLIIYITDKKSQLLGFCLTISVVCIVQLSVYKWGLPFNLANVTLFSPSLYASNTYLSSLGALIINTCCVLWVVLYIARHIPYKDFLKSGRHKILYYSIAGLMIGFLCWFGFSFTDIISSLVVDSNISFDVNHFYAINSFTILALFTIGTITGLSCMIIYMVNVLLNNVLKNKWLKYILLIACGLFYMGLLKFSGNHFHMFLFAWIVIFIILLDVERLKMVSDLFTPHMIFWALFICGFCTGIIQFFNQLKERESRKVIAAQRISPEHDDLLEFEFGNMVNKIMKDREILHFFQNPVEQNRKILNERIESYYPNSILNKYQPTLYAFNLLGKGLHNKDTGTFASLSSELRDANPTTTGTLFYKEQLPEGHHYLSFINIINDSTKSISGYIIVYLSLKPKARETVYPELLQAASSKSVSAENEYAYAVYVNGQLREHTNNYEFPFIQRDSLQIHSYGFYDKKNYSELWYKYNDKKMVMVVRNHNYWFETLTLFSYMFGIEIAMALIILLYQLYLAYFTRTLFVGRFIKLSLTRRVHYSMLVVVLFSFVIIGIVTVYFFKNEYNSNNISKLRSAVQFVDQSVNSFMKDQSLLGDYTVADSANHKFKYFIAGLANSKQIDINVYDSTGRLYTTSQEEIFDKGLLARLMRPDALIKLNKSGNSILIQDEKIGSLSYMSCYVPVRNWEGHTLAYLNVPFFSSEKDLNFQISNIVITLINLYAFIFLVSGVLTVLITRWLTRSLTIIISRFGSLNLKSNERIEWPYDDEIGLLVREYNRMLEKVEENAILLAQSERETAWREMARQVAHEIKNPLTPMKLNLQYLQQALKNDKADVKELVNKVSASLVEQIDNLSYIASEFSDFAKMPEARPQKIDLCELAEGPLELYINNPDIVWELHKPDAPLYVYADKSQMLRVLNNLFENAKQAISEDSKGHIEILLRRDSGKAYISVKDNGRGMNDEVKQKVFQPYFTTKSSGTGLGLAMTKKIIEFWNGEIVFESTEGVGTIFEITLPLM